MILEEMKGKKVLVLGAVADEIPLVNAFHELGCYVIVAGKGTDYPCCPLADKVYDVDIMDKELILEIAKAEGVVAVTSNVVERAIRIAAWVSDKLGLESIGYEIAKTFTNKYLMRQAAKQAGIAVPAFEEVKNVADAIKFAEKHNYPYMIKPVDNGGSRGVQKIKNIDELTARFDTSMKFSQGDNSVIIEEYIEGVEYNVDAFTYNYKCENTNIATKNRFDIQDTCVPKSYILLDAASCNSEFCKKLLSINKQLVEGMKLKFGITHANYIYNTRDNNFYLVEITARGGGDGISAFLVENATSINPSYLLACYSLGYDVLSKTPILHKGAASAWFGFSLEEGEIISVEGVHESLKVPGVIAINSEPLKVGNKTVSVKDGSSKYGPIWVRGNTIEDCVNTYEQVKKILKIEVRSNDGKTHTINW